jgi:hypothetical protein
MAPFSDPGSLLSEQPQKAPLSRITPIRLYERMVFKLSLIGGGAVNRFQTK